MNLQRMILRFSLLLAALGCMVTTNARRIAAETNWEKAQAARQEVLAQPRRIFFNDDTHELDRQDANTPEGFLKRRLKPLIGTGVDVISWSVLGGLFDAPVYDSQIQPVYGDAHPHPPPYYPGMTKNVRALIDSGHCPLQLVIDFAHTEGMEVFASVRMNDCHDSFLTDGITTWKRDHPEFWVDSEGIPRDRVEHPLGLYWTAQDFTHQQVRDRKFEIIEEVCQRYDIDGIDLNFMRHPVFFGHTMQGLPVSAAELDIMTRLIRRIRRLTDARGLERDRPILIAAIVPDSFQLCKNVGLDLETWIEEDLVDIVIPGLGYAPFSLPVDEFVGLAHRHGVKVYPCINRKAPQQVPEELVAEGFRGITANWYAAGADGIFFWNLGTPFVEKIGNDLIETRNRYYAALPDLRSLRTLQGKDKLFCLDDSLLSYYQHVSSQPPLPVKLPPGESKRVTLFVADDLQAAARDGSLKNATMIIQISGMTETGKLSLSLNNQNLIEYQTVDVSDDSLRVSCHLNASQVKQGNNVVQVTLQESGVSPNETVQLNQVRLLVRYGP